MQAIKSAGKKVTEITEVSQELSAIVQAASDGDESSVTNVQALGDKLLAPSGGDGGDEPEKEKMKPEKSETTEAIERKSKKIQEGWEHAEAKYEYAKEKVDKGVEMATRSIKLVQSLGGNVDAASSTLDSFKSMIDAAKGEELSGLSEIEGYVIQALESIPGVDSLVEQFGAENPADFIKNFPHPKSTIVDLNDLPFVSKWCSYIMWIVAFLVAFFYFSVTQYKSSVGDSFLSTDINAGDCSEVPLTITGTFLADTNGNWETSPNFRYVLNAYAVTLLGLEYTLPSWSNRMTNIQNQVMNFATKAVSRDFAWNLVSEASFQATFEGVDEGYKGKLTFYSSGSARDIFYKNYPAMGFANHNSTNHPCKASISHTFNQATANLAVNVNLCESPPCTNNPCPDLLAPQAFGYDTVNSNVNYMTLTLNLQAVTTALSVNLGMVALTNLEEVSGDTNRIDLFNQMGLSEALINYTSTYYDPLYPPSATIYCTNYTYMKLRTSACYVRQGNTLMYPVTVSKGYIPAYYKGGVGRPLQCTQKAASTAGPGKYYCNLMDVVVGFIYYPVANVNITKWIHDATFSPTLFPTSPPSYGPGKPTPAPVLQPSRRPSISPNAAAAGVNRESRDRRTRRPSARPVSSANHEARLSFYGDDDFFNFNYTGYSNYWYYYYDDFSYSPHFDDFTYDDKQSVDDDKVHDDYSRGQTNDDFEPTNPAVYDNGKIFQIGYAAAKKLNTYTPGLSASAQKTCLNKPPFNCSNGDLAVSNAAYEALLDTLGSPNSSFTSHFDNLCGPGSNLNVSEGCALFAFEVDGGQNRNINDFYFQPTSKYGTVAYANSIYSARAFAQMQQPPTSLTQIFYSCVMTPQDAVVYATGLAKSNAELYLTIFFTIWMTATVFYLNKFGKLKKPVITLAQKKMAAKRAKDTEEAEKKALAIFTKSLFEDLPENQRKMYIEKAKMVLEEEKKKEEAKAKEKSGDDDGGNDDKGNDDDKGGDDAGDVETGTTFNPVLKEMSV